MRVGCSTAAGRRPLATGVFFYDKASLRVANNGTVLFPERFRQLGYVSVGYGKLAHNFHPGLELGRSYDSGGVLGPNMNEREYAAGEAKVIVPLRLAAERAAICAPGDCKLYGSPRCWADSYAAPVAGSKGTVANGTGVYVDRPPSSKSGSTAKACADLCSLPEHSQCRAFAFDALHLECVLYNDVGAARINGAAGSSWSFYEKRASGAPATTRPCTSSVIPDKAEDGRRPMHTDEVHTAAALAALAGWSAQPPVDRTGAATNFLLMLGLVRPHLPWDAPQRFWDLYPEDTVALPHAWNLTRPGLSSWSTTAFEVDSMYPDTAAFRAADPAAFPFNMPARKVVAMNRGYARPLGPRARVVCVSE